MNFKEINEIRKQGDLKKAYSYAEENLKADPENIWNKRAMAWVYYGFLKANATPDDSDKFIKCLKKLNDLQLPNDENLVFDKTAWQIGKMVFMMVKHESIDFKKLNQIFDIIRDYHFSVPSEAYSFLHKAFLKAFKNGWNRYEEFVNWWDLNNFLQKDYQLETIEDGTKVLSITEQAFIAYSKCILNKLEQEINVSQNTKQALKDFLPFLNRIINKHPEFEYPPYYKGKLLLAYGSNTDEALTALIPFAKRKDSQFWAWELLADVFPLEDKRNLACLAKALSLNFPENFIINTRQKMAHKLIKHSMYPEAKTEIQKILNVRNEEGWKIPNQVKEWQNQQWYQSTEAKSNNLDLYESYSGDAEELLYRDEPEHYVAVEFVNKDKKILNFIHDKSFRGFFKYKGKLNSPQVGDTLRVRMKKIGNEGRYQLHTAQKVNDGENLPALKAFTGHISLKKSGEIGFVKDDQGDIFIPPNLIADQNLNDGQPIQGKAILSYNKSRNEWGWKTIEIL